MSIGLRSALASAAPPIQGRPGWETIAVLVTVKAYPVISRKAGEAVCVAGVRLDTPRPEWVRLFPVGFRDLPREKQFAKYQVVSLRARHRGGSDRRPETYQPDLGSLRLGEGIDTDNRTWRRRWELVDGLVGETTTCALLREARVSGQAAPSLGLIKPRVTDVTVDDNPEYKPGGAVQVDVDLFGNERDVLEKTPFVVTYRYRCEEPGCKGHDQSIIDWESGQLARVNLEGHMPGEARRLHREKFLDELCGPGRDTYFYVGNQHQRPGSFLVLGVFWPPANSRPQPTFEF